MTAIAGGDGIGVHDVLAARCHGHGAVGAGQICIHELGDGRHSMIAVVCRCACIVQQPVCCRYQCDHQQTQGNDVLFLHVMSISWKCSSATGKTQ